MFSSVVAIDGTTCTTPSYFDSFEEYDYENVIIYVYGDRRTDAIDTLQTKLADKINELSLITSSEFKAKFQDTMRSGGMDGIYQGVTLSAASSYPNPVLTGEVGYIATNETITLTGLELSSGNGYFYAIADIGSKVFPTYDYIRAKQNATKYPAPGANTHYISPTPARLTISGLSQNTTYNIYYYASNEDLSGYGRVTDVQYLQATTLPTDDDNYSAKLSTIFTTLLIVLLILIL